MGGLLGAFAIAPSIAAKAVEVLAKPSFPTPSVPPYHPYSDYLTDPDVWYIKTHAENPTWLNAKPLNANIHAGDLVALDDSGRICPVKSADTIVGIFTRENIECNPNKVYRAKLNIRESKMFIKV